MNICDFSDIEGAAERLHGVIRETPLFESMKLNQDVRGRVFIKPECLQRTGSFKIRGAYNLVEACKEKISEKENELSKNKSCSWMEVECLGACVNAPMMQINDDYYEDLNKEKTIEIFEKILKGETPKPGSYRGRLNTEPENNRKTLMDIKNA